MRVAAVQFDIAWEDKAANHRVIEQMLDGADLPAGAFVLLPELGDTGFSFDLDVIVDDRTLPWATDLARRMKVWIQAGHARRRGDDGRGRNCATIISPTGRVTGTYEKVHPFSYGRETEHYSGGGHLLVRRCEGAHVCPLICYDLRFPELWRAATLGGRGGGGNEQRGVDAAGAEVFTIGASWPEARQTHWRALLIARAIENLAFVVSANRVGRDPHLGYAGGSIIVGPSGEVLAEAGDGSEVIQADLDVDALRDWRSEFPALRDARPALLGEFPIDRPSDRSDRT